VLNLLQNPTGVKAIDAQDRVQHTQTQYVLPNDLMQEQSLSDLALQLRAQWMSSKEVLK
jgi:hypothetical protein